MSTVQTLTGARWIAGLAVVLVLYRLYKHRSRRLPLPPGPKKLPLVGNMFDIPAVHTWETYMAWSNEYNSDILHLDLAGTSVIVLSSVEAADALLNKRSAIYSDRPRFPMVMELMGWSFNVETQVRTHLGDEWRAHRRLLTQGFTAKASAKYRPKQLAATHELLRRIMQGPDDFMVHFRHWAADITMRVTYGIDVQPVNDPYVSLARAAVAPLSIAGVPGKYLVDSLPILKYVPSWFPGAGFKRDAARWSKLARQMADVPLAETKRQIELGIAPSSFVADGFKALKERGNTYYTENTLRAMAGTLYVGGADTVVSAMASFVLGMLANPEAQRTAQAEIDLVTQGKRLPNFEDEAVMPFVAAIVKETLRWKNVLPIAVPHYLNVADEFRGYSIPANSIVIGNTWAILHDETVYPDPYEFKPERFLSDGKLNTAVPNPEAAFGFGRRACPGKHMANASVWVAIASILATFDITKAVDKDGQEIQPSYEFDSGFINNPLPFKCSIQPRCENAETLVAATNQGRCVG
ncbi:cytochrome P450 [Mycena metata]|uniref:Cytochrome P450 n=1 Tax=Mycena metata TaxID=1033252 RepID=A0AAD7NK26_9AGAR|nr:cytochrome P450 [Mycena metata]